LEDKVIKIYSIADNFYQEIPPLPTYNYKFRKA